MEQQALHPPRRLTARPRCRGKVPWPHTQSVRAWAGRKGPTGSQPESGGGNRAWGFPSGLRGHGAPRATSACGRGRKPGEGGRAGTRALTQASPSHASPRGRHVETEGARVSGRRQELEVPDMPTTSGLRPGESGFDRKPRSPLSGGQVAGVLSLIQADVSSSLATGHAQPPPGLAWAPQLPSLSGGAGPGAVSPGGGRGG